MTFPTHFKPHRWTLALCLGLAPASLWAAAADWNCVRSQDNQRWVCDARKPETPDTGAAPAEAPAEAPAPRARKAPPAESVQERREVARPAEAAPSVPAPEAPARAATPEPLAPAAQPKAEPESPAVAATPSPEKAPAAAEAPLPAEPAARPVPAQPSGPATAAELKRVPETVDTPAPAAPKPAAAASAARSGWNCTPGEADESGKGWNCSLTGTDPRGMVHEAGEGAAAATAANWAEATTITGQDEQRFGKLMSLLPADPWRNVCAAAVTGIRTPPAPMSEFILSAKDKEAREKAPLEIRSDYFEMLDSEVANFSGGAELVKADQKLWGDFVTRNLMTNAVNAHGSVVFQEKGLALSSDTGFLDADTNRGVFRNSQFILPSMPARGTSRLTHLDSSTLSRYENFTYTTCPPGDQDWLLHASNVKINKDTGTGTARNAWVEFKDVPFFYTPYISFPIDQRRQSGLLSPSLGVTKYGGVNGGIPYYFNLAPNYDYTVFPRYWQKRGFQLNNEFRYLTETTRGRIIADIVPDDMGANEENQQIDYKNATQNQDLPHIPTTRGQAAFLNDTRFTENLIAHVDANYVSDYRYLNEFGSPLSLVDRRNIRSIGYVNYTGTNYLARAQIDYYQTIDPTTINVNGQPYFHLPQLLASYFGGIGDTGLQFETPVQFDSFDTSANQTTTYQDPLNPSLGTIKTLGKATGQRLKLRPKIYYPFQTAAGFITPSFTLQHNEYWFQDPENWTLSQQQAYLYAPLWTASGQPYSGPRPTYTNQTGTSESFTVPILSLDSGTYFDRDFELADTPMLQTLEPRLFYVYIPKVNQSNIPVFDSSLYDFTYYQLFRENRFTGGDRVGDTNQLTLSLTTRLVDQTSGLERLRASIGNAFYFTDREVTLAGPSQAYPYQLQSNSNLIGDVTSNITQNWSVHTGGQWNPDRNQIDRGIVAVQYNNRQNEILNLAYRYRRNQSTFTCPNTLPDGQVNFNNGCLDLTDVSFRLPIVEGWHAIGRWQYSLQDKVTVESFAGIERETCCWRFTLIGRHYINNIQSGTGQTQGNNGVFVQLELKGLGMIGDQVDQFLQTEISGYRFRENY